MIGARVRWYSPAGTNFGRVVSVDGQTLTVRVEESTFVLPLEISAVTVLSAPGGAK